MDTSKTLMFDAETECTKHTMQVSCVTVGQVGRCKSASAADFQVRGQWRSRNCQPEGLHVASCTENAASERPRRLAARLSLANDAGELMCRRRGARNSEAWSGGVAVRPIPSHVIAPFHTECHCEACCSCSPFDRRSGNCPAFTFPVHPVSVRRARSLDLSLAQLHSCSQQISAASDPSCTDAGDLEQNSVESDAVIHKSSSVPACCSSQMRYYNAGISFDSLIDDSFQTNNTGVDSASTYSSSTPACDDAKSANVFTQCPDESHVPPTEISCVNYMNDKVSPLEYHKRFEVCSFTTGVLNCSFMLWTFNTSSSQLIVKNIDEWTKFYFTLLHVIWIVV